MKTIVLNHKMNLNYSDVDEYIKRINKINKSLIIAPSNIYLIEFLKKCHHQIASQDVCYIEEGNYTGKVSWSQIKSLGIKYSLIGHSEKKDNLEKINAKLKACLENDITPILCISNFTKEEDIIDSLKQIKLLNDKIIYAYEPIFNIGSKHIDNNYIEEQIKKIHTYLTQVVNIKPTIIYGGGINKENINTIYHIKLLDGILIGGISSNISEVEELLKKIDKK